MFTPETEKPKNYISTSISKTLLTPCRRIGLSRTKKKVNDAKVLPLLPIENASIPCISVPHDYEVNTKSTLKTSEKNLKLNVSEAKAEEFSHSQMDIFNVDTVKSNLSTKTRKDIEDIVPKNTFYSKEKIDETPSKGISHNIVHETVVKAKECNPLPKNSNSFTKQNDDIFECKKKPPLKRLINFEQCKIKSNFDIHEQSLANKKRKCKEGNELFTKNATLNSDTECKAVSLTRFTTDDYLREYASNPEQFTEKLKGSFDINDDLDDFNTTPVTNKLKKVKTNNAENKTQMSNLTTLKHKDYIAVVCNSVECPTEKPRIKEFRRSLSLKKLNFEPKSMSKVNSSQKLHLKNNLTVSLERLSKQDIVTKLSHSVSDHIQDIKRQLSPKIKNVCQNPPTNEIFDFDDEDAFFSSSPKNDQIQRNNLLKLCNDLENKIKEKEEKLSKLKQAQVYKNKHSPAKIKMSTDLWLGGCEAGLKDLFIKMQEHGPIDMTTLIKNLKIPAEILEKLKL